MQAKDLNLGCGGGGCEWWGNEMTLKWPVSHWLASLSMAGGPGKNFNLRLDAWGDIGYGTAGSWRGLTGVRPARRLGGNIMSRKTGDRDGAPDLGDVLNERAFWYDSSLRPLKKSGSSSPGHSSSSRENSNLSSRKPVSDPQDGHSQGRVGRPPSIFLGYQPKRLSFLRDQSVYWYRNLKLEKDLRSQEREVLMREEQQSCTIGTPFDADQGGQDQETSDVTVICFDIETTGFSPRNDRIIEFAARDLSGGAGSTIQSLVNPQMVVRNEHVHKISSQMVNDPAIPRWREVGLAILDFVENRRKGDGIVILVAHNGKRFDVPFILTEFQECGLCIPSYWRFADSLVLARLAMKGTGKLPLPGTTLGHLFRYYGFPAVGEAHRAMVDVNMLSQVLQMLMSDLQMSTADLLAQSSGADEIVFKSRVLASPEESGNGLELEFMEASEGRNNVENTKDSDPVGVPWDLVSAQTNGKPLVFKDGEEDDFTEEPQLDELVDEEESESENGAWPQHLDRLIAEEGLEDAHRSFATEEVSDVRLEELTGSDNSIDSPASSPVKALSDISEEKGSAQVVETIEGPHTKLTSRKESNVYADEDLRKVCTLVCATLQNQPATQALFKQKGVLVSISGGEDKLCISIGSSMLFVKKFEQHVHATALETAFTTVLKQPVKIEVSVQKPVKTYLSTADR